jgi:cyclophilin family peptidyl-prolyl cis-trans isomerase
MPSRRHLLGALLSTYTLAASREDFAAEPDVTAPSQYRVRVDTTRGSFVMEAERALAPHGADRFYQLVMAGYYDDSRFFRVIKDRFAQFGIAGNPGMSRSWKNATIAADPEKASNERGSFGFAMVTPDARTTQIFICTSDSMKAQDGQGFAIFGHIVAGMEVVDALYAGYGETSGGGVRANRQDKLFDEGNAYLDREFPRLDRLIRATPSDAGRQGQGR